MKLALVGTGRWAQIIALSLPPDVEIAAVVSGRTGLPTAPKVYPDIADVPFEDLDGIIVANEASKHINDVDCIREIAPLLPIFVEKPLGMDSLDANDIATRWNSLNPTTPEGRTVLLVDHTQLFNQGLINLKKDLGGVPPAYIHGMDRGAGPFRADCNPLWDYGPHAVSVALYLAGFPFPGGTHVKDAWLDRSPQGCTVDFELQLGAKTMASFSVGNNAVAKARHCTVRSLEGVKRTWEGLVACSTPPLTAALAAFCSAVEAGHAPEGDVRFGWALPLEVTRVLAGIEEVLRKRCTPL